MSVNIDESQALHAAAERPGKMFWVLMALTMLVVGAAAYLQYKRVDKARTGRARSVEAADLPVLGEVPEFSLIERSGRSVSLADLGGKVWVADFVFTYCAGPCPIMSRRMRELQDALRAGGLEGVMCVSVTVDPQRDTPAVLSDYATMVRADPDRWWFLTGDKEKIYELAIRGFKLGVTQEVDTNQIIHSTRFVLVDRRGRIRGYYAAMQPEEELDPIRVPPDAGLPDEMKHRLLSDIRSLLREARR